jgi:hypothetical protein
LTGFAQVIQSQLIVNGSFAEIAILQIWTLNGFDGMNWNLQTSTLSGYAWAIWNELTSTSSDSL